MSERNPNLFRIVHSTAETKSLAEVQSEDPAAVEANTQREAALNGWWSGVKDLPPRPVRPGFVESRPFQPTDLLEQTTEKLPKMLERLALVKKILPHFPVDFFMNRFQALGAAASHLTESSEPAVAAAAAVEAKKLKMLLASLERKCQELINQESQDYLGPLLRRARGDVRMFLLRHFNTIGLDPGEAQTVLQEKWPIEVPFSFGFRTPLFLAGEKKDRPGVMGDANSREARVFYDELDRLANGEVDEMALLSTFVHEIIHTVSDRRGADIGLEDATILGPQETPAATLPKPSETYLNELVTEFLTYQILGKYYEKPVGALAINKPEAQQIGGYEDIVGRFLELRTTDPKRIDVLTNQLLDGMVRGNIASVKESLAAAPDIQAALRDICEHRHTAVAAEEAAGAT